MVDDIVGITEAGIKAQQMNAFINIKTAEKSLQFGVKKRKSMLVGKCLEKVINSDLLVDEWSVDYIEDKQTGDVNLVENYCGLTEMGKTDEQKYLGFVLSSTSDNMANIREVKKKSIGVVKSALNKLDSLKLKYYYFECSVIILNIMVRSSILYASEMYYDLKDCEVRHLERIEEGFMRKVLNTTKGCPIKQLYLTLGHQPARFEIIKMKLLFLKYILHESDGSLISKFFYLQLEMPTKGDWASSCLQDLKDLKIFQSLEEIKNMSYYQFKKLVKKRLKENAFVYLKGKIRSKGKENIHLDLSMAEYLLPINKTLTIEDKQKLFAVKNRMVRIPANFNKGKTKYICRCGSTEDMEHIFECQILSNGVQKNLKFNQIYNGNLLEQIEVFRIFENNLERRENLEKILPCDLSDPLFSVLG